MCNRFNTIDADSSGTVDYEELNDACERMAMGIEPEEMQRLMVG